MDGPTPLDEPAHIREEHKHKLEYGIDDITPLHISLLYGLQVRK